MPWCRPFLSIRYTAAAKGCSKVVLDAKGVISSRTYILFINHNGDLPKEVFSALEAYVSENNLVAGVSESRGEDCSLHDLLRQSELALRIRRKVFAGKVLLRYTECRRYYLYEMCSQQDNWERYVHPCLDILERHDQSNAPALEPTLRCLVKHHGNRTETAKELGIQRNTLQYRLGKIEELSSVDLSNPEVFDQIVFSFNLKRYCNVGK